MDKIYNITKSKKIAATEWGDVKNPMVIMLHGGGQTRHSWKGSASKIANLGFHVIAYDLRGHGESFWDENGDYTFNSHKDDLIEIIKQNNNIETVKTGKIERIKSESNNAGVLAKIKCI